MKFWPNISYPSLVCAFPPLVPTIKFPFLVISISVILNTKSSAAIEYVAFLKKIKKLISILNIYFSLILINIKKLIKLKNIIGARIEITICNFSVVPKTLKKFVI